MAQNSARLQWTEEEVDAKLKNIMQTCFRTCYETGKEFSDSGALPSRKLISLLSSPRSCVNICLQFTVVVGANVAGFLKVANAAKA